MCRQVNRNNKKKALVAILFKAAQHIARYRYWQVEKTQASNF